VRIKHEVSAQNRGDGSTGANRGDNGQWVCDGVHECGCHAANQVKHQIAQVPPCVFNIIAGVLLALLFKKRRHQTPQQQRW
jgi:hypothetical protein